MLAKFLVLFFTVSSYYCLYHNNKRSGYKIEIPKKYIKLVFPLLDNRSSTEVDIIFFLDAAYLLISCIIYYIVIILGLISFKIATIIWIGMFAGTSFVMLGTGIIRCSGEANVIIAIIHWIEGIIFMLVGLLIIIVTIIGRYDLILEYLL